MSEEMTQRNKEICKLREQGMTFRSIASQFNISVGRIREIYIRECNREKLAKTSDSVKVEKHEYNFIDALIDTGESSKVTTRAINCLYRNGFMERLKRDNYALDDISDEELLDSPCLGVKTLSVIRKANDIYRKKLEDH